MILRGLVCLSLAVLFAPLNSARLAAQTAAPPAAPPAAKPSDQKAKFDPAQLVGEWSVSQGTRQGAEIEANRLPPSLTFTKDSITLPTGADDFVFAYELNTQVTPIAIDLKITGGPVPDGKALGILRLSDNEMTLCYEPSGQTRPTEFKSTEDNGCFLFVLKKSAAKTEKGFDPKNMLGTWTYAAGNKAGEELPAERLVGEIEISEKDFTLPAGPSDKFVMSYKLDAQQSPVAIDLKIESGPAPEGTALGIVKFDGEDFVLCYDPTGQKRPEKFDVNEDNGFFLFRLQRRK